MDDATLGDLVADVTHWAELSTLRANDLDGGESDARAAGYRNFAAMEDHAHHVALAGLMSAAYGRDADADAEASDVTLDDLADFVGVMTDPDAMRAAITAAIAKLAE